MIKFGRSNRSGTAVAALMLIFVVTGCAGIKKPWRDYSKLPFNSADWKTGDKIERGRMSQDWQKLRNDLQGRTPDTVREMLGEPDLKRTIENREVWFYRVDIGIAGGMDLIPVSFDDKGKSMFGMVRGSTFSAMAKEDEL